MNAAQLKAVEACQVLLGEHFDSFVLAVKPELNSNPKFCYAGGRHNAAGVCEEIADALLRRNWNPEEDGEEDDRGESWKEGQEG